MFSKIFDFVISNKLLTGLPLDFLKVSSLVFDTRKSLPKPRFNLGDWVWIEFIVDDPRDPDDGKRYKSVGYVTGFVYHHPDWTVTDVNYDYVYYVQLIYEDGFKISSCFAESIPGYELHLLV